MSKSNKVVIATGIYPPDIGGPATYVPLLAHRLTMKGFNVHVVTLSDKNKVTDKSDLWNITRISRQLPRIVRIPYTVFVLLKVTRNSSRLFANGLFEEAAITSLFKPKLRVVMKIVGDPVWERFRNSTGSKISLTSFNSASLTFACNLQRRFLNFSLNRSDLIFTPSRQLADLVSQWRIKSDVKVINNGIKCRDVEQTEIKFDVISVSRLVTWKNIDLLIKACAAKEMSLAVCGDGPERASLETLAKDLNADVHFFGNLSSFEIRDFLNSSKIFALISDYEGLSFSLIEAMMAGKEILVSSAQGNVDVISNEVNGYVVEIEDENSLLNCLSLLKSQSKNEIGMRAHSDAVTRFCAERQLDAAIDTLDLQA